jgi:hypothetical protein
VIMSPLSKLWVFVVQRAKAFSDRCIMSVAFRVAGTLEGITVNSSAVGRAIHAKMSKTMASGVNFTPPRGCLYDHRAWLSLGCYVVTLMLVCFKAEKWSAFDWIQIVLLSLWVVGPAIFFVIEYFVLYAGADDKQLEALKNSQEVCAKAWVAGGLLLAAAYSKESAFGRRRRIAQRVWRSLSPRFGLRFE